MTPKDGTRASNQDDIEDDDIQITAVNPTTSDRIAELERELGNLRTSYVEVCEQLVAAREERDHAIAKHATTAALHSAAQVEIAELNGQLEAVHQSLATVTAERDRLFRADEQKAAEIVRLGKEVRRLTDVAHKLDKRRDGYRKAARMNANVARVMAVYAFGQKESPNVFVAINTFPSVCKTAGVDLTPDLLFAVTKAIMDGTSLATVGFAEQADEEYSDGAMINDYLAFRNLDNPK